jgi:hypothetical protein
VTGAADGAVRMLTKDGKKRVVVTGMGVVRAGSELVGGS